LVDITLYGGMMYAILLGFVIYRFDIAGDMYKEEGRIMPAI